MQALWPDFGWMEGPNGKECRTPDGRVVVSMARRYATPEWWRAVVMVYDARGCAGERLLHLDIDAPGTFEEVLQRAKEAALASGHVTEKLEAAACS